MVLACDAPLSIQGKLPLPGELGVVLNVGKKMILRFSHTGHLKKTTLSGIGMFLLAPYAIALMLGTSEGIAFTAAVSYLRFVALLYTFCFTGNTFTGYYSGTGRVMLPFIEHLKMGLEASPYCPFWTLCGSGAKNTKTG